MGPKLTPAKAQHIRQLHAEGKGVRELARELSLDPGTISRTVRGLIWRGKPLERIHALEVENARLCEVVKWAHRLDEAIVSADGDGIIPTYSMDDLARALASLDRAVAEYEARKPA